jgi:hypothetical protein
MPWHQRSDTTNGPDLRRKNDLSVLRHEPREELNPSRFPDLVPSFVETYFVGRNTCPACDTRALIIGTACSDVLVDLPLQCAQFVCIEQCSRDDQEILW